MFSSSFRKPDLGNYSYIGDLDRKTFWFICQDSCIFHCALRLSAFFKAAAYVIKLNKSFCVAIRNGQFVRKFLNWDAHK